MIVKKCGPAAVASLEDGLLAHADGKVPRAKAQRAPRRAPAQKGTTDAVLSRAEG